MIHRLVGALAGAALVSAAGTALAQPGVLPTPKPIPGFGAAPAPTGPGAPAEVIKVHARSLEGNLEGDAVDRDVVVILPPSYAKSPNRRYPVIYFLHGFGITADWFAAFMHAPETMLAASKKGEEFILVLPDTDTKFGGSMYSNSPTTGDFESFVANDLVSYIDSHYRTLAKRSSRGLVGHSMGGYGTWKIAMDHPQKWSSVYAMSACCMSARKETLDSATKMSALSVDQAANGNFGIKAGVASMVAWSPNPKNPPFYADFPLKDGAVDQSVLDRWAANSPIVMVSAHVPALKSFTAIASDGGDKDGLTKDAGVMHEELDRFGVANAFEVYDGNHVNRIAERFDSKVLPFFAQHLATK
jgi:enterochelin esterase-like enzyme